MRGRRRRPALLIGLILVLAGSTAGTQAARGAAAGLAGAETARLWLIVCGVLVLGGLAALASALLVAER
jgi:hypothetical protein